MRTRFAFQGLGLGLNDTRAIATRRMRYCDRDNLKLSIAVLIGKLLEKPATVEIGFFSALCHCYDFLVCLLEQT